MLLQIKMNKLLLTLLLGLFLFSSVSAFGDIGTVKQGDCISLYNYCPTCTYINLTAIQYPDKLETMNLEMTKDGINYNYTFCDTALSGDYSYTTCGDKDGALDCEDITFESSPSGKSGTNNIIFYIIILLLGYILNLLGFFKQNAVVTILGGIILVFTGLYMVTNGIVIYRNSLTLAISYITLFWGAGSSLWAAVELIEDM